MTSKISNLLLPLESEGAEGGGGRESYPANDISNKYFYDAFYCLLFIAAFYCLLFIAVIPYCCFFTFWYFKGGNHRLKRAEVPQLCKTGTENSK